MRGCSDFVRYNHVSGVFIFMMTQQLISHHRQQSWGPPRYSQVLCAGRKGIRPVPVPKLPPGEGRGCCGGGERERIEYPPHIMTLAAYVKGKGRKACTTAIVLSAGRLLSPPWHAILIVRSRSSRYSRYRTRVRLPVTPRPAFFFFPSLLCGFAVLP